MVGLSLLLSSTFDPASVAQSHALLARGPWERLAPPEPGTRLWARGSARLWQLTEDFLHMDAIDERWAEGSGGRLPKELIFLSRHASASGKPCLTVHPIGVAWRATEAELASYGGRAGFLPPPSRRLGPLYRRLCRAEDVPDGFDVSLEASHHGPFVHTPSLFVEIGSSAAEWSRDDAAAVLANVLWDELGLEGHDAGAGGEGSAPDSCADTDGKTVLVGVGGGHYCAKIGDAARKPGVALGHMLATYSVRFDEVDGAASDARKADASLESGGGANAIRQAVVQSASAFEGAAVRVQVDKKAFKAWQRDAVLRLCDEEGWERVVK